MRRHAAASVRFAVCPTPLRGVAGRPVWAPLPPGSQLRATERIGWDAPSTGLWGGCRVLMLSSTIGETPLASDPPIGGRAAPATDSCPQCGRPSQAEELLEARAGGLHKPMTERILTLLLWVWAPLVLIFGASGFIAGIGSILGWSGLTMFRQDRSVNTPQGPQTVH